METPTPQINTDQGVKGITELGKSNSINAPVAIIAIVVLLALVAFFVFGTGNSGPTIEQGGDQQSTDGDNEQTNTITL